jgi:hypothetical protein
MGDQTIEALSIYVCSVLMPTAAVMTATKLNAATSAKIFVLIFIINPERPKPPQHPRMAFDDIVRMLA